LDERRSGSNSESFLGGAGKSQHQQQRVNTTAILLMVLIVVMIAAGVLIFLGVGGRQRYFDRRFTPGAATLPRVLRSPVECLT
jgi:hypothetical protein